MLKIVGDRTTLCNETFLEFCTRRRREARDQIPPMRSGYEAFAVIRSNLAHVEQAAAIQSGVTVDQETGHQIILPERSWKQPLWVGLAGIGMTCIAAAESLGLCLPDPEPEGFDRAGLFLPMGFSEAFSGMRETIYRRVEMRFRSAFEALGVLHSAFDDFLAATEDMSFAEEPDDRQSYLACLMTLFAFGGLSAERLGLCRPEPGSEAN